MSKRAYSERECIHREKDVEGEFYKGLRYIKAIQRLRCSEAVEMAQKVEQFYWSDAEKIVVWLCNDCARALRMLEPPNSYTSLAKQSTSHADST